MSVVPMSYEGPFYTANAVTLTHGIAKLLLRSMGFWQLAQNRSVRTFLPSLTTKLGGSDEPNKDVQL